MTDTIDKNDVTVVIDKYTEDHIQLHYRDCLGKEKHGVFNYKITGSVLKEIIKKIHKTYNLPNEQMIRIYIPNIGYDVNDEGKIVQCDYLFIVTRKVLNDKGEKAIKILTAYPKIDYDKKTYFESENLFNIDEMADQVPNYMIKAAINLDDHNEQRVWFLRLGISSDERRYNLEQTAKELKLTTDEVYDLLVSGLKNMKQQPNCNEKK